MGDYESPRVLGASGEATAPSGVAMRDAAGSPHTGSPDVGWGGQDDPSESHEHPVVDNTCPVKGEY